MVYEVTGAGTAYVIYHDPGQPSPVVLPYQRLPWRIELPRQPVRFLIVTASRDEYRSGPRTARILVDRVEVCMKTDHGVYRVAGCDALVSSR